MAKPITNRVKMGKTPVIRKDLEGGVIAEANNDGSIYVDKSVKKGSPLEKEAIAHEKVHLNQMKRGDLNYDDNNVYWKGKAYPRSSMNEGAKNLPWEKEAYDKTKHMKKNKKSAPTKMSDADLVAGNKQAHKKFTNYGKAYEEGFNKSKKKGKSEPAPSVNTEDVDTDNNSVENNSTFEHMKYNTGKGSFSGGLTKSSDYKFGGDAIESAFPMKANPITAKTRSTSSPLHKNGSGLQSKSKEEFEGNIEGGGSGKFTIITKSDVAKGFSRGGNIPTAKGGYSLATDPDAYMAGIRKRFPYTTAADLAAKNYISKARVSDMESKYPASEQPEGEGSTSESREVSFTPDKVTTPGKPAEPGTYNMPLYEARNLRLSSTQKRKGLKQNIRRATRDYYKFAEPDVKRKDRKLINPESGTKFDTPAEYMAYMKKAKSSYVDPAKKRYGAKPATEPTTGTAPADKNLATYDKDGNLITNSSKARLEKIKNFKYDGIPMNSNKNKAPFKMKGYGKK